MSMQMKHSIMHLILWSLVFIFFLSIFLTGDTLETWGDNRTKTLVVAALFIAGFGGDAVLNFVFRKRKDKVTRDERDDFIQKQALSAGFIVTILYVFLVAISLYTRYETSGMVPAAWLWFLAYSLVCVANMAVTAFSVFYYRKGGM
jgi:uncharacterized BrkB/YihY/UPF0761 family membrane protein